MVPSIDKEQTKMNITLNASQIKLAHKLARGFFEQGGKTYRECLSLGMKAAHVVRTSRQVLIATNSLAKRASLSVHIGDWYFQDKQTKHFTSKLAPFAIIADFANVRIDLERFYTDVFEFDANQSGLAERLATAIANASKLLTLAPTLADHYDTVGYELL